NIWGVLVGAAFLSYLNVFGLGETGAWINSHIHAGGWHPHLDAQLYQTGIYGVIILVVMLFRPEGLLPSRRRAAELHEGLHDEPLYDVVHTGAECPTPRPTTATTSSSTRAPGGRSSADRTA